MSDSWEPVIGIEVHVQLSTQSKIFSSTASTFGAVPNQQANLIDLAMPGALPVLNENAVLMALKFGLAIDAEIADTCIFDRKNYFYPDLPKGYQISQFEHPIVGRGVLDVLLDDGTVRKIGITRAHLEEDAGKSVHDRFVAESGIDLNRAGTPLLEIVTDPDLRSAADAAACFRQLHTLVTWLDICDGNLAEGSMRCDANVSVRRKGETAFGERTEIKNVNSFRFVERALLYEIDRQIAAIEAGESITRETRQYNAVRDMTFPMRGKELSDDYRYFPDPDLLPLRLNDDLLAKVQETLPELPRDKHKRFIEDFDLSSDVAVRLTQSIDLAEYFERTVELGSPPQQVANWLLGSVAERLNREDREHDAIQLSNRQLHELIGRVEDGTLSSNLAKEVFDLAWVSKQSIDTIIDEKGLRQVSDLDELTGLVQTVIDGHPTQVAQIREGRTKVIGFMVGQVMKATKGKADPKRVNELLRNILNI